MRHLSLRAVLVILVVGVFLVRNHAQTNETVHQAQKVTPQRQITAGQYSQNFSLKQVYEMPCDRQVPLHLRWCALDHGYNEGAKCGLQALTGSGVNGLPADAEEQILGNTWDRKDMMRATTTAWNSGARDAAANAAVCCQIHNPPAHACLQSRPDLVKLWLARQSSTIETK